MRVSPGPALPCSALCAWHAPWASRSRGPALFRERPGRAGRGVPPIVRTAPTTAPGASQPRSVEMGARTFAFWWLEDGHDGRFPGKRF